MYFSIFQNIKESFNKITKKNLGIVEEPLKNTEDIVKNIPFSFCIINKNKITFCNDVFVNNFGNLTDKYYREFCKNLEVARGRQVLKIDGTWFQVFIKKIETSKEEDKVCIAYFVESIYDHDNSQIIQEKPAVGYIFIDNYNEALEKVEEYKRPIVIAMVDKKLSHFARNLKGILRKFEKDKYLIVFADENIINLKESKFQILDEIVNIELDSSIPLTLSIGIGYDFKEITEAMDAATSCIDLALGRGGNQAVLKNRTDFEFYGGHSKEVVLNTRVRARVKSYLLIEQIMFADKILIMGHKDPDMDCLGASVGMAKFVKMVSEIKTVKVVKGKNLINVKSLCDRLETEWYDDVFIKEKDIDSWVDDNTLIIVLDTFRECMVEYPDVLKRNNKVVVFDHHRKTADYIKDTVLIYHESSASSTSELVTEMFYYINKPIKLMNVEADALLCGIIIDTKSFAFKTSSKTFEAAAFLRNEGADNQRIRLLMQSDMETYKIRTEAVNSLEVYRKNYGFSVISTELPNPSLVIAQAADEILNIVGMKASFVLYFYDDEILISARSIGKINVQTIMEKMGGGGHMTMAATKVKDKTLEETTDTIKKLLDEQIKED